MKKFNYLLFGLICYMGFLGTISYAIGFVGNMLVPRSIDGKPNTDLVDAILTNASLLLLFGLQHSIMARPAFKKWWTTIIPPPLERSVFVLCSSICMMLMMWFWQPMGGIIWSVSNPVIANTLHTIYFTGWGIVFISTFLINHFDLFGVRQVWLYFKGQPYTPLPFQIPLFYKAVRHPLYLGFIIAFWSTPVMTVAHLLFSVLTTGYIITAIPFEEKDLITHHGEDYLNYKKWAPMLLPLMRKRKRKRATAKD